MQKHEAAVNILLHLPLLLMLALAIVKTPPVAIAVATVLFACGVADLMYAKLPQMRRGILISFGPSEIPLVRRDAYFRAYRSIMIGSVLQIAVITHQLAFAST
ncbi:hypothetical protein CA51_27020 [Rosistilla oblonga]|nr:hypothetical protein CA51_27020 [Rosistilla oblonga]